jgi:hypothetical protein
MDAALIEAAVLALEQLVPAVMNIVQSAGLDPNTAASYTARIQAAMANVTKPAG